MDEPEKSRQNELKGASCDARATDNVSRHSLPVESLLGATGLSMI